MNYILTAQGITLSYDGNFTTISKGDHRYPDLIEAVKENRWEDIPSILDMSLAFCNIDGVELIDGRIEIEGRKIPDVLTERVLNFKENDLPFEPLIKFSKKLLDNPSFNSRQQLYKFLEHNGHPLTKDGNFIAYKGVRNNFTDCHTGNFDNSIGQVVEMDRNEVDDNPNNTCSSGLHVAAFGYADGFGSVLLEVEVNPQDVVSVPNEYNGEKMRVCKYKVRAVCESKLETELYDYDEDDYNSDICDPFEIGDLVRVKDSINSSFYIEELYPTFVEDCNGNDYLRSDLELV